MDWLKKLPVVGPLLARLMLTHAWRSFERLDRVKWTRLAAAIAAATLSKDQQNDLQDKIAEQVPGISDQLDIQNLVDNCLLYTSPSPRD